MIAFYARVTKLVGAGADQPPPGWGWIKASWPAIGGEHPDWLRPAPGDVLRAPTKGGIVLVEEVPGEPGTYWWRGEDEDPATPAEAVAAWPDVAALAPPGARCFMVLDGRKGSAGAVRLVAGGAHITIRNDGVEVEIEAGTEIRLGATAAQAVIRGDAFRTLFNTHIHPTPSGPSGPPTEGALSNPMGNPLSPTGPHLSAKVKTE